MHLISVIRSFYRDQETEDSKDGIFFSTLFMAFSVLEKTGRFSRFTRLRLTALLNFFLLTLIAILAGYSPGIDESLSTTRNGYFTKLISEVNSSSKRILLHRRSALLSEYINAGW